MLNDLKEIFSKNFIILMKKNKMTQLEISKALNVTQSTISNWVRGKIFPSVESLDKLTVLFNCSIEDLIGKEFFSEKPLLKNSSVAPKYSSLTLEDTAELEEFITDFLTLSQQDQKKIKMFVRMLKKEMF